MAIVRTNGFWLIHKRIRKVNCNSFKNIPANLLVFAGIVVKLTLPGAAVGIFNCKDIGNSQKLLEKDSSCAIFAIANISCLSVPSCAKSTLTK